MRKCNIRITTIQEDEEIKEGTLDGPYCDYKVYKTSQNYVAIGFLGLLSLITLLI